MREKSHDILDTENISLADLDKGYTRLIVSTCAEHGLLRNQAAYVLATAFWETARTMEPVREAFWLSENWRKKNLRYYPWYGRGFVQLTWEENYRRAARETGAAVDENPDLALDAPTAAEVLVIGSAEGWFTGKKLSDYITLTHSDFLNARRIINGTDKAAEIAAMARDYDAALKAEGYGEAQEVLPEPDAPAPKSVWAVILEIISKLFGGAK